MKPAGLAGFMRVKQAELAGFECGIMTAKCGILTAKVWNYDREVWNYDREVWNYDRDRKQMH